MLGMPSKHEYPNLIWCTHIKSWILWFTLAVPRVGEQREADP